MVISDRKIFVFSTRMLSLVIAFLLSIFLPNSILGKTANQKQAEEIFQKAYKQFTGPEGCSFSYKVNLIGLYKNAGSMWTKGKKQRFVEKRYLGWTNEEVFYKVDKKNKEVNIYQPKSPDRDKYSSKFVFNAEDYEYDMKTEGENYVILLDKKGNGKSTIKHAQVTINRKTNAPKKLRLKVLFFWANIELTDFKCGITDDSVFNFPKSQFSDYKFQDHREKE